MVRMDAVYDGDLHTSCRHGPSGAELATDAPVDNQGRGESFSPTDLLVTALGSCMMTIMGIAARDRGWPMEGARVSLEKHMQEEPRRVARIVVRFDMPAALPAEARGVLEEAARACPVCRSLHPDIEIERQFVWS
jgi:putative redox protein